MHRFNSLQDAQAAGFALAQRLRVYLHYRGCVVLAHMIRPSLDAGLFFGLRVEISEDYTRNYLGVLSDRVFGSSVPVELTRSSGMLSHFSSLNGQQLVHMFEPAVLENALQEAQAWTDRWFQRNPQALERYMQRRDEQLAARSSKRR